MSLIILPNCNNEMDFPSVTDVRTCRTRGGEGDQNSGGRERENKISAKSKRKSMIQSTSINNNTPHQPHYADNTDYACLQLYLLIKLVLIHV